MRTQIDYKLLQWSDGSAYATTRTKIIYKWMKHNGRFLLHLLIAKYEYDSRSVLECFDCFYFGRTRVVVVAARKNSRTIQGDENSFYQARRWTTTDCWRRLCTGVAVFWSPVVLEGDDAQNVTNRLSVGCISCCVFFSSLCRANENNEKKDLVFFFISDIDEVHRSIFSLLLFVWSYVLPYC